MNIDILKVGELKTNCYIVYIDNNCLIIDPGADENFIISRIKELDLKVLAVLVTHNHEDHNKCAKSIASIYGVEVYDYNNLFEQEHFLDPFKFRVIYTPGHSSDSITFYFPTYEVMFTGDFLFKGNVGRTDLPTGSYIDMIKSIYKINEYPASVKIYPGHGDKTTLEEERENNEAFSLDEE